MDDGFPFATGGGAAAMGSSGAAGTPCQVGTENCPCYVNEICNAGLLCTANLCLRLPVGGAGGAAGDPGFGGISGLGGAAGDATTAGRGGEPRK